VRRSGLLVHTGRCHGRRRRLILGIRGRKGPGGDRQARIDLVGQQELDRSRLARHRQESHAGCCCVCCRLPDDELQSEFPRAWSMTGWIDPQEHRVDRRSGDDGDHAPACPGHRGWSPDHRRGHLGDLDRPARYRYRAGWVRRIHDLRRTGPPTVDALQFPATQNYDNGTVIRWDEPTSEGGRETLHPVPALTITEPGVATADGTTPTDSSHRTATFVAVVGVLAVAAITAAGVLAVHRRRARQSAPTP